MMNQRIRQARAEQQLSQEALSKRIGVSRVSVTQWESGDTKPRGNNLLKLAEALKTTPEWIANGQHEGTSRAGTVGLRLNSHIPLISWAQAEHFENKKGLPSSQDCDAAPQITPPHGCQTFALKVEGDSMTSPPGRGISFPSEMIIYIDPDTRSEAVTGDFIVARPSGSQQVTFKQLASEEGAPILRPLNSSSEYNIIRGGFDVIGKVIYASWGVL